jgi:hypothetical protein
LVARPSGAEGAGRGGRAVLAPARANGLRSPLRQEFATAKEGDPLEDDVIKVTLDSTVCQDRNQDQVSAEVEGEVMMMSLERGNYYSLDAVGSQIWNRIEEPIRVSALCDALMEVFDVDRAQCQRDVLAFLTELAGDRLVEVTGPDTSALPSG